MTLSPKYAWLAALHDGTITHVQRGAEGAMILSVDIEYLTELLGVGDSGLRVELVGVTRAEVVEWETSIRRELAAGECDFTILSVDPDRGGVRIHGVGEQLDLHYESVTIRLEGGAVLSVADIERAAAVYWHRWEARGAGARLGLRLRLGTEDDLPLLRTLYRAQLEVLATFNSEVAPDVAMQTDWVEKPGVLFAWLIERAQEGRAAEVVGMVLVGNHKLARAMNAETDFLLWEFYIEPSIRRQRVGSAALELLMAQHPGSWTVEVLPNNGPAMAFWKSAIGPLLTGTIERIDEEGTTFVRHTFSTLRALPEVVSSRGRTDLPG